MQLVPTRSRQKISHLLSYPIGAERISIALASVPQYAELVLHFQEDWYDRLRFPRYPYLMVDYSRDATSWNSRDAAGVNLLSTWNITVKPVRRETRHKIQQHMLNTALGQTVEWFTDRATLVLPGSERLLFFYDEDTEEFSEERESRLEPERN